MLAGAPARIIYYCDRSHLRRSKGGKNAQGLSATKKMQPSFPDPDPDLSHNNETSLPLLAITPNRSTSKQNDISIDDEPETSQTEPHSRAGAEILQGNSARLWASAVHIVPMVVGIILVRMSVRRWYWFNEELTGFALLDFPFYGSTDTIRNALQLVAKLYELVVVASLATLTLKVFKRQLVESKLPIGLLTGAYRVGDIRYIFSPSFVVGLNSLVGPASAILMVPELDWYPVRYAFDELPGPVVTFYDRAPSHTWPDVLEASALLDSLEGCDSDIGGYPFWCPAGGFPEIRNWVSGWRISLLRNHIVERFTEVRSSWEQRKCSCKVT